MSIPPILSARLQWSDNDRLLLKTAELGLDRIGPFTDPTTPTPDGRGTYRRTAKGAIFQSDLYGGVFVAKSVMDVWTSPAVAKSGPITDAIIIIGGSIQGTLGLPVKASSTVGDATVGWFENGVIVARPSGGFAVYGPTYIHFMKLGGPGGWAGLPTSSVMRAPGQPGPQGQGQYGGGTVCRFQSCDIYWSKATGAAEVHGLIRDRYNAMGGSAHQFGYPTTDELPCKGRINWLSRDTKEIGRFNQFERGSIYWSPPTGAWPVDEWMLPTYLKLNGPSGELGFPTGTTGKSPGGRKWYLNFQNGVLYRPVDGGGDVRRVNRLDLYIERFEPYGGDGYTGGAVDLIVRLSSKTSDGQAWNARFPEDATSFQGTAPIGRVVHTFPVRDGGMVLDVTFEAWDDEGTFKDRRLGTVVAKHTIDYEWQVDPGDVARHDNFRVVYNLDPHLNYDESKVRQDLFWQFPNVQVPELSKDHFAQTYRDVEQDEEWWLHPFNALFYETVYRNFGQAGICFGLSLEAARAHRGQSVSNEPINRYVSDPIRMNEAIVRHGYQLGGDQIDYFVEQYILGNTREPVRTFNEARAAYARGDYPILSISNDSTYTKGHAVMPYKWDTSDPNRWVMFIANPNNVLAPGSGTENDDNPGNVIEILNPKSGNPSFVYKHTATETWSGDASSGGRMLAIPLHVLAGEPRTPFWEVLIAAIGATVILCADGGQTESVYTGGLPANGRPPRLGSLPPGVTPIPFHDAPNRALQMLRVDRRAFADAGVAAIAHRVRSNGQYSWGMRGPGVSAVVRAKGSTGIDTLSVGRSNVGKPAEVRVAAGAQGLARAMTMDLVGAGLGGPHRRFRIDGLSLPPGRSLSATLESGGEELVLRGVGQEPLDVRVTAARKGATLSLRTLRIDPTQAVRVRPTDWRPEGLGAAKMDVQVLDARGGLLSRRMI